MVDFFIIGAQRSGTTLLRLILNGHPSISIPEESTFLMPLLRKYRNSYKKKISSRTKKNISAYLLKNHQFSLWDLNEEEVHGHICKANSPKQIIDSIFNLYMNKNSSSVIGDKTPSYFRMIPILKRIYPSAKYIHIIRDGRGVYSSWKKKEPTKFNAATAALDWIVKTTIATKQLQHVNQNQVLTLYYEDILKSPENQIRRICNFLELNYSREMLQFWKNSNLFIGKHHSDRIFTPIDTKAINEWKTLLQKDEITIFNFIANAKLLEFHYSDKKKVETAYIKSFIQIISELPLRISEVIRTKMGLHKALIRGEATSLSGSGSQPSKK